MTGKGARIQKWRVHDLQNDLQREVKSRTARALHAMIAPNGITKVLKEWADDMDLRCDSGEVIFNKSIGKVQLLSRDFLSDRLIDCG
jgi:hypothetical protein